MQLRMAICDLLCDAVLSVVVNNISLRMLLNVELGVVDIACVLIELIFIMNGVFGLDLPCFLSDFQCLILPD